MPEIEFLTINKLSIQEITRLFSKIKVNTSTQCWEWLGHLADGYGKLWLRGEKVHAHRIVYAWTVGPIPKGRSRSIPILDHKTCDNRRCCNPVHMVLTSHRNNILRGMGGSGINSRKTHCSKGHLLPTEPNLKNGRRYCKICNRAYKRSEQQMEHRRQKARERYYKVTRPRQFPHLSPPDGNHKTPDPDPVATKA